MKTLEEANLSPVELEVFLMVEEGLGVKEMSQRFPKRSIKTIETHLAHIKAKLGVPHMRDLIRFATLRSVGQIRKTSAEDICRSAGREHLNGMITKLEAYLADLRAMYDSLG